MKRPPESLRYATKKDRPEIDKRLLEDLRRQGNRTNLVESTFEREDVRKPRRFKLTLRLDEDLAASK